MAKSENAPPAGGTTPPVVTQIEKSSSFQALWERALDDYNRNLPSEMQGKANLRSPDYYSLQSIDDLMAKVEEQHKVFDDETGVGPGRSNILRGSLGGLGVLIDAFGGAAGTAFPPCSQILGAASILIEAGKKVTGAFEEVSALFDRIGTYLRQLKALSQVAMEPELETCVANVLTCTLRILGLATRKAYHSDETIVEQKEGKKIRKMWKKTKQVVMSRGSQYLKQLFLGEDPDITNAVSQLHSAVEDEQSMIAILVKRDTTETRNQTTSIMKDAADIKEVTNRIKSLSQEICETEVGIQQSIAELQESVQDGVQQVGAKVEIAQVRVVTAVGRMEKKSDETTKLIAKGFEDMQDVIRRTVGQPSATTSASQGTQRSMEVLKRLRETLDPQEVANQNFFQKIKPERAQGTSDWILEESFVKKWMNGHEDPPILVVSGKAGSGKTFLAARIVEHLKDRSSTAKRDLSSSVAYFFCRKNLAKLSSVKDVLCTLAFQISELDGPYTTHLSADARIKKIKQAETVSVLWDVLFSEFFSSNTKTSSTLIVIDSIDDCRASDDFNYKFEDFLQALKDSLDDSKWKFPKLRILLVLDSGNVKQATDMLAGNVEHYAIAPDRTLDDLERFVSHKLRVDWGDCLVTDSLQRHVHYTIQKHCKGDFLRTSLILEEVTSLSREDDIWELLSRPPETVAKATSLVLRRLRRSLDKHGLEDLVVSLKSASVRASQLTYTRTSSPG